MRWWLVQGALGIVLLFGGCLCAAQSTLTPPRPPSPAPPAPNQAISLFQIDDMIQWSLCSSIVNNGCLGAKLQWLIDLSPFPLTTGTGSPERGFSCIGDNGTGCKWRTIQEYSFSSLRNTKAYIPLELKISAQNITQMFQLGHPIWTQTAVSFWSSSIFRQLKSLSISCANPAPVFAPYVLEPLIMALSGAGVDYGWKVAAAASPTPPSPPKSIISAPTTNTTSDGSTGPPPWTYSRLYSQPTNGSSALERLTIRDCKLTGQLPPASFWLQLPSLVHLDLSRNELSGAIPATFGPSPPLSYLNLSYNRLSGPLTASLVRYGGCGRTLDLSYNDLRGEIPGEWLSNVCSMRVKDSLGLLASPLRRQLQDLPPHEVGPDGGIMKVTSSDWMFARAANPLTAVTEGTTPSSSSSSSTAAAANSSAVFSDSYAFWLSYPMSYMYGSDDCPMLGVAWKEQVAARVLNGTDAMSAAPLNFTVLLYGNPKLRTPGNAETGYAIAPSHTLHFRVRDNSCTVFDPRSELLWVWAPFGGAALLMLAVALVKRLLAFHQARTRVAPDGFPGVGVRTHKSSLSREDTSDAHKRKQPDAAAPVAPPAASAGKLAAARVVVPSADSAVVAGAVAEPTNQSTEKSHAGGGSTNSGGGSGGREVSASPTVPTKASESSGGGGGEKARLIVVAHQPRYSASGAVQQLGSYLRAVVYGCTAFGAWFLYDIPWVLILRTIITIGAHVSVAGLTYAMSLPQRRDYCTYVRHCGPYLYIVPPVLSCISIGLTVFLMNAVRELARCMSSQVAAANSKPDAWTNRSSPTSTDDASGSSAIRKSGKDGTKVSFSGDCREVTDFEKSTDMDGKDVMGGRPPVAIEQTGSWVSGLHRSVLGSTSLPSSAEANQFALALPVSESTPPLYDACSLPAANARIITCSPIPSTSGASRSPSSAPKPNLGALTKGVSPSPSDRGGGGGGNRVSPINSLSGLVGTAGPADAISFLTAAAVPPPPSTKGSDASRSIRADEDVTGGNGPRICASGPVAESCQAAEDGRYCNSNNESEACGAATAGPAAAEGRFWLITRSAWSLPRWLHGKSMAFRPLLPASPYRLQSQHPSSYEHDGGAAAAAATRARASLQHSFSISQYESSCGSEPGPSSKPGTPVLSTDRQNLSPRRAGGDEPAPEPGPVAEANESMIAEPVAADDDGSLALTPAGTNSALMRRPSQILHGTGGRKHHEPQSSEGRCHGIGEGPYGDVTVPGTSTSSFKGYGSGGLPQAAVSNEAACNVSQGGGARSGDGPPGNSRRTLPSASSRRASLRPSPILPIHGSSIQGSPTAAPSPGSLGGRSSDREFEDRGSPAPRSTVEPIRKGGSLASSSPSSTRASRRLRVAIKPDPAAAAATTAAGGTQVPVHSPWCSEPQPEIEAEIRPGNAVLSGQMSLAGPQAMQQSRVPAADIRPPESPAPSGPSKRGGPWLEDRLAALATLSASGSPQASGLTVGPRMPSVAAAAVAATTPRRRGGGEASLLGDRDSLDPAGCAPGSGGGGGGRAARHLQPEALHVVSQYLCDYTFGKPGSGWKACTRRTLFSFAVVLLIITPLAPLIMAAALLGLLLLIAHSAARACSAFHRRLTKHNDNGGVKPASSWGGDANGQSVHFWASLRLSGSLMLALHTHVVAWVMCLPLALFTGVLYGLAALWGTYTVPLQWVWLACNSTCLAAVLLLLHELTFQKPLWEHGVCRYPYAVVVLQHAAAVADAAGTAGTDEMRRGK